jgi:hypothetical protein
MKLLSFQPGSIYFNGGCGRVLRRLYMGREKDVISVGVNSFKSKINKGPIEEKNIFLFPYSQKWLRWKLRDLNNYTLKNVSVKIAQKRIDKIISAYDYDIMHIINHGVLSAYPCRDEYIKGKKLWVSFHDYYSESDSTFNDAQKLWQHADRRLVISEELGLKYSKEFGEKEYEIITDGLNNNEIQRPKTTGNNGLLTIYFGGLLHYDYLPLFRLLADVIEKIIETGNIKVNLVLRGVKNVPFLNNRRFTIEYRNNFVSDQEIAQELNEADILYLPIKFTRPGFYLYSLSTKMIGYLGAPGKILYHGPEESAACKLLNESEAAICCTSLQMNDVVNAIGTLTEDATAVSSNAKQLAGSNFRLESIQKKFWNN